MLIAIIVVAVPALVIVGLMVFAIVLANAYPFEDAPDEMPYFSGDVSIGGGTVVHGAAGNDR